VRPRITKEQVFNAADSLVAAGIKVTVDAVREITGGSDGTVNVFLRLWKALRGEPLRVPLSEDEMNYVLSEQTKMKSKSAEIQQANRDLVEQAKQKDAEITRLLGEIEALERERAELKELNARSELERESLLSDRARIVRQLADSLETIKILYFCAGNIDTEINRLRIENEERKRDLATERERNLCQKQELEDCHQRILNLQAPPQSSRSFEVPDPR